MKDNVNHPEHYLNASAHPSVEPIMLCRLFPFNLGNAIKYIIRAEYKGHTNEDYSKAIWYLEDFKVNNKVHHNNFNNPHFIEYHIIHWFIEENNTAGRILRKLFDEDLDVNLITVQNTIECLKQIKSLIPAESEKVLKGE